jgi:hypothetical protein
VAKKKKPSDDDEKPSKKSRSRNDDDEDEDEIEDEDDIEDDADDAEKPPKNNIYVGLGVLTLLALITSAVLLYLNNDATSKKQPPAVSVTAADLVKPVGK